MINEQTKELYETFKKYDITHDLVGMFHTFFQLFQLVEKTAKENSITVYRDMDVGNYHKMVPHLPAFDYRKGFHYVLYTAAKADVTDLQLFLQNLYVALYSGMYVYHLPVEKTNEMLDNSIEMSYDDAKEILLADGMSPNLLK